MVIYGLGVGGLQGTIPLVIGITAILSCMQEQRAARWGGGPYGGGARDPWASDPDGWRGGGAPDPGHRARPGLIQRWRSRRAEARAKRAAEEQARDRKKLDDLLDKVHREGMSALSESERRFLERASKDARRR
jgi:hypothetical protein